MLCENISELIGGTPMLHISRFAEKSGAAAELYAKLERSNPAGSAKDRVALYMIRDAEQRGDGHAVHRFVAVLIGMRRVGKLFLVENSVYVCFEFSHCFVLLFFFVISGSLPSNGSIKKKQFRLYQRCMNPVSGVSYFDIFVKP